jgi:hypothetical protein
VWCHGIGRFISVLLYGTPGVHCIFRGAFQQRQVLRLQDIPLAVTVASVRGLGIG